MKDGYSIVVIIKYTLYMHKQTTKITQLKYKKRLLLRYIHFKSDLINNMDHMRISGIEPSSVILMPNKVD